MPADVEEQNDKGVVMMVSVKRARSEMDSEGRVGGVYEEAMFHHLLSIEQARVERSGRPFLLLLVDFIRHDDRLAALGAGSPLSIPAQASARLFSSLGRCLRETDFVGWYRTGLVAGAVLTEIGEPCRPELVSGIEHKVRRTLQEGLPSDLRPHLRVRVYPRPEPQPVADHGIAPA